MLRKPFGSSGDQVWKMRSERKPAGLGCCNQIPCLFLFPSFIQLMKSHLRRDLQAVMQMAGRLQSAFAKAAASPFCHHPPICQRLRTKLSTNRRFFTRSHETTFTRKDETFIDRQVLGNNALAVFPLQSSLRVETTSHWRVAGKSRLIINVHPIRWAVCGPAEPGTTKSCSILTVCSVYLHLCFLCKSFKQSFLHLELDVLFSFWAHVAFQPRAH